MFIDTHCHIHEVDYPLEMSEVLKNARDSHVEKMICVGTSQVSSKVAVLFAEKYENMYASIGVHPHDTSEGWQGILETVLTPKIVAVGEIGLDYFYNHSPKETQVRALQEQLQFAVDNNLPVIFHVREAFDDFWPIYDSFKGIRGVLHSFTDTQENFDEAMRRGLYVGVNGISTFTKNDAQKEMFAAIPLDRLLLETDAPFLTPAPFRGKINEPAFVRNVAEFHANARGIGIDEIAHQTTANANALFAL